MKKIPSLFPWFTVLGAMVMAQSVLGAPVDWPTLGFTPVVTNAFSSPTCITHAGDGSQRLFVMEQGGRVWIIQSNAVLAQPFLNITNRVLTAGAEQGLLGLAFPPAYSTKGHFYVDYTRQTDGAVVISRFSLTVNSNVANTNSEQVILVIPKPYNNHNAGQLAFGPDGYLYIGVGDGGSEGDPLNYGQNTSNLLGKLLRIDVESGASPYAIPPGNPSVGKTNYAPEIWAYGLRNPWRFSFDRSTGDLYTADVGQNLYEEIDFQAAGSGGGQNYGWRIMEGPSNYVVPTGFTNFSALTLPVAWYNHYDLPTDGGAAVIGGYVYRGPSQPRMDGLYFFGDFVAGWIWGMKQVGANWQAQPLLNPGSSPSNYAISTFGEDDLGQLYLADYYKGNIYQIGDSQAVCTPIFPPGNYPISSNTVVVSCVTPNAVIHYTTNGVDPGIADPVVVSGGTIQVSYGKTNKARAFRSDLAPSAVASAAYVLVVGIPTFNPPAGGIVSNTLVTINDVTPGAAIYYTTNGAYPTTNSRLYTGPLTLTGPVTVETFGAAGGFGPSSVNFATYRSAPVPSVMISFSNNESVLSWPTSPVGFILETTSSLSPGAIWNPLTNGVATSGSNFVFTNQMGASTSFYRLHQQ